MLLFQSSTSKGAHCSFYWPGPGHEWLPSSNRLISPVSDATLLFFKNCATTTKLNTRVYIQRFPCAPHYDNAILFFMVMTVIFTPSFLYGNGHNLYLFCSLCKWSSLLLLLFMKMFIMFSFVCIVFIAFLTEMAVLVYEWMCVSYDAAMVAKKLGCT